MIDWEYEKSRCIQGDLPGQIPGPQPSPVPVPPQDGLELRLLRRQVERMALCPDHRDKATGWCIVCQAEKRTREELRAVPVPAALREKALADAAEMLWVVLANVSGGDWTKQSPEWQEAAARWRDNYFAALAASPAPSEAGKER